jgi:hypothetical protein
MVIQVLCFLLIATVFHACKAQTTVVTYNNTCDVSFDLTAAVMDFLPGFLSVAVQSTKALATLYASDGAGFGSLVDCCSIDPFTTNGTTTRQYLWSLLAGSDHNSGIGYSNGNYLAYSYQYPNWALTWCAAGSSTLNYYAVDPVTGVPTSTTPYKTSTFVDTGRPWYTTAIANTGNLVFTTPYGSATNSQVFVAAVITTNNPNTNSLIGTLYTLIPLTKPFVTEVLSDYLVDIAAGGNAVVYVMTTSSYILLVSIPLTLHLWLDTMITRLI